MPSSRPFDIRRLRCRISRSTLPSVTRSAPPRSTPTGNWPARPAVNRLNQRAHRLLFEQPRASRIRLIAGNDMQVLQRLRVEPGCDIFDGFETCRCHRQDVCARWQRDQHGSWRLGFDSRILISRAITVTPMGSWPPRRTPARDVLHSSTLPRHDPRTHVRRSRYWPKCLRIGRGRSYANERPAVWRGGGERRSGSSRPERHGSDSAVRRVR